MSSYIDEVLVQGEEIEYIAHTSLWAVVQPIAMAFLMMAASLVVYVVAPTGSPIFALIPLGLACCLLASAWITYKSTELVITSKRVVAKFGFISRRTIEISLLKIESIQVRQGVLGRMLNFGDLTISGASDSQAPIPGITEPLEFRRKFAEIHERALRKAAPR